MSSRVFCTKIERGPFVFVNYFVAFLFEAKIAAINTTEESCYRGKGRSGQETLTRVPVRTEK